MDTVAGEDNGECATTIVLSFIHSTLVAVVVGDCGVQIVSATDDPSEPDPALVPPPSIRRPQGHSIPAIAIVRHL